MCETKTYVFPENGGGSQSSEIISALAPMLANKGVDPSLLALMKDNDSFGGNNFLWIIFLFFLMSWGGNGFGGRGTAGLANEINNDYGRDLLMQAINGNGNAIGQLATTLNCDIGRVQSAISAVGTQVQAVANSVGMTGQQVINSIQAGNAAMASQLASCCCEIKNGIVTQGYENRLASQANVAAINGRIDAQTTMINDRFCALEMREMQNKVDALREENGTLKSAISNGQQTAAIQSYVASAVNPVASALAALQSEVASVKCKLPDSVTIPYSPVTAVPNGVAYALGLYGYGLNGLNNPVWG